MGMKPYYQDKWATIYHGDCREVLPSLGSFDVVITDPPYNCGKDYGGHNDRMSDGDYAKWCAEVVHACLPKAPNQFWVAPRYKLQLWLSLIPKAHLIVVRRGAAGPFREGWSDQFEIALASGKPCSAAPDLWDDIRLKGEGYFFREETYGHPGYTPFPIMQRAIELLADKTVLEPFCGTGTTLRAAKDSGRISVGIELNEAYCEIAAKRLAQEVFTFTEPNHQPQQLEIV